MKKYTCNIPFKSVIPANGFIVNLPPFKEGMIMKLFNKLTHLGVSDHLPEEIQEKIILANKINLVLLLMQVLFLPLSKDMPAVNNISIISIIVIILLLAGNSVGLHLISRFMTSIYIFTVDIVIHGMMVPPDQPMMASIIAISMAFLTLPFVLFHFGEKKIIIAASSVNLMQLLALPYLGKFLYIENMAAQATSAADEVYTVVIAYGFLVGSLLMLMLSNKKSDDKRKTMLEAFEKNKQTMEATQQELQNTLKQVEESRKEDEKRNWAATGLARFSEMLRNSHTLNEIYSELISGIVKYLDANQAALFELTGEEGEKHLEMTACYAYGRKKHLQKTIAIGQGLVGQTYLEGQTLKLSQIPADYVSITSGLGEATPRFMIIVPLKINEQIEGILEIASFKVIEDYQIAFLEKLGESIASAIASHKITIQTEKLLAQSKIQTEELRSQEEEMRQNMEELQATQEEMYRKEKEYLQKIETLEKALEKKAVL